MNWQSYHVPDFAAPFPVVEEQQGVAGRVQGHADGQQGGPPALVFRQEGAQGGDCQGGDQQGLDP